MNGGSRQHIACYFDKPDPTIVVQVSTFMAIASKKLDYIRKKNIL
jgi:hypothetical protein